MKKKAPRMLWVRSAYKNIVNDVLNELDKASSTHLPMHSAHEGHSIIEEEYEELKEHVFTKHGDRDIAAMRGEAIQLAAMAMRFILDIVDSGNGQK